MGRRFLVVAACALACEGAAHPAPTAFGAVRGDPGVSDSSIAIGATAALTGLESAYYAPVAKGAEAYFEYVNDRGGVYGRTIDLKVENDEYDPAQTVLKTRELVEQDRVFAIFNSIGNEQMLAVRSYLNTAKVPQLFVGTGSRKVFQGSKQYPWTMAFLPSYVGEGRLYGRHIAMHVPNARIAVLYENDDYGNDLRDGLRKGLHGTGRIVGAASYELTDEDMSAQIASLKAMHANTLALFGQPKQVVQAFIAASRLGWQPHYYVSAASNDPDVMNLIATSAGKRVVEGAISSAFLKFVTDPNLAQDKGAKLYRSIMKTYCDGCDSATLAYVYGMAAAYTLVDALKRAGKNLSRQALLLAATHLNETDNPFVRPGIAIKTSSTDYVAVEQLQMFRYHRGRWSAFGTPAAARP